MMGSHVAAALNQADDRLFANSAATKVRALILVLVPFLTADVGLVHLNRVAIAAKGAARFWEQFAHALTDAMGHKPRRAVAAEAEHAPKLMGADALLAGGHEMSGEQPFVQRNVRTLIQRAHGRREWLLTGPALVQARSRRLAVQFGCFTNNAAMRAYRTIRPAQCLEMLASGGFIGENLGGEVASHGCVPNVEPPYRINPGMSSA